MLRTLGDELISSETVAVIELVKNAYDADARRVLIKFEGPLQVGSGSVAVIDDGEGMTRSTVLGAWMEPATPNRQRARRSRRFNRAVLGEKGIGRFAAARLARYLDVYTKRARTAVEFQLSVDWKQFDKKNAYLDQVNIGWKEAPPTEISKGGDIALLRGLGGIRSIPTHGTVLRARSLNIDWDEAQIQALRTGLARLLAPDRAGMNQAFSIALDLPEEFGRLDGPVEPPETLSSPQYRLVATIDRSGKARVKLSSRAAEREKTRQRTGVDLWQMERKPTCGPLTVELRVWDRDRESLGRLVDEGKGRTLRDVRRDLDAAAGISIFRDGFRVFPYGEPGNDWLGLDLRRVQFPTGRISNNQVVGFVGISSAANPELRDQSNREGLIAGRSRDDLRRLVLSAVARLETERLREREKKGKEDRSARRPLFDVELTALADQIRERHQDDPELLKTLEDTESRVALDVDRVREVVSRYQRLATLGQLIDVVLHDGRTPLSKLTSEVDLAQQDLTKGGSASALRATLTRRLGFIRKQAQGVAAVFARIEPFAGRKRGRPRKIRLEDAVADTFQVYRSEIERLGVHVDLPKSNTTVTVEESELQRVLVNLLTNSLHWLSTVNRRRRIKVEATRANHGVEIIFSDNGPGVEEGSRDHIFEPYFTTKVDGVGLGLSIAGDIVTEFYGGALELVEKGPLSGATFRVILRKRA